MTDRNYEQEAISTGWVPEDQFKGDPEKWKPAKDWVERGETFIPFIQKENRGLKEKLESTESRLNATTEEIKALRTTMEKMASVNEKVSKREYERALKTIRKQQAQAIADSDPDAWEALEEQKDKLEKPEEIKIESKPDQNKADPNVYTEWSEANKWYMSDNDMTMFANAYGRSISQNDVGGYKGWLNAVEKKVRETFPHKFQNPNRETTTSVDSSDTRGNETVPKKKNYQSLPPEAKAQCDKLVASIPNYTKEEFVADYYE